MAGGEWRSDLDHIAEEMERLHKNLFHKVSREEFTRSVKHLQERVPSLARHQVIVEIARIVAMVGDAHTCIYLTDHDPALGFHYYPLKLWLADGVLFIRATG